MASESAWEWARMLQLRLPVVSGWLDDWLCDWGVGWV